MRFPNVTPRATFGNTFKWQMGCARRNIFTKTFFASWFTHISSISAHHGSRTYQSIGAHRLMNYKFDNYGSDVWSSRWIYPTYPFIRAAPKWLQNGSGSAPTPFYRTSYIKFHQNIGFWGGQEYAGRMSWMDPSTVLWVPFELLPECAEMKNPIQSGL